MRRRPTDRILGWAAADFVVLVFALFPVLWIMIAVVQVAGDGDRRQLHPQRVVHRELLDDLRREQPVHSTRCATRSASRLIATVIAVVLAAMAAYAIARLNFPGKAVCSAPRWRSRCSRRSRSSARSSTSGATLGPLRHLARPDHPVPDLRPAAGDLHARRRSSGRSRGSSSRRRRSTAPRRSRRSARSSCRSPRRACSPPRSSSSSSLERLPVRDLADLDVGGAAPSRRRCRVLHRRVAVPAADGSIAAAAVIVTIPIIILVLFFQRRIVAGLTAGAVKG